VVVGNAHSNIEKRQREGVIALGLGSLFTDGSDLLERAALWEVV